jgi:hypothetical protein
MSTALLPDLEFIRQCIHSKQYYFTKHGFARMRERKVTTELIEEAIGDDAPQIVEINLRDERGPSCCIKGTSRSGKSLFVVVGYLDVPEIITVYWQPE